MTYVPASLAPQLSVLPHASHPGIHYLKLIGAYAVLPGGGGYFVFCEGVRVYTLSTMKSTIKLSYRKDDRAMRPIYECPENFPESLTMPTATFPAIFNGLFFRLML